MKCREKCDDGIEGALCRLCLFGVSLVDEEFHGQVEDADGNRVCRDNRKRQVEEVHRICRGRRPGEEGEENPEEEFKDERIEEGPEPEIVVVMLQTVGEESCRDALDDGESAVDEGGIRIDEEGAVDADDGADGRPYDRSSDEATEDDPDGSEIVIPPPALTFQYVPQSPMTENSMMKIPICCLVNSFAVMACLKKEVRQMRRRSRRNKDMPNQTCWIPMIQLGSMLSPQNAKSSKRCILPEKCDEGHLRE